MRRSQGILSLFLVGGYYAYRSRFKIQRFLESRGIRVPLLGGKFSDQVRSGAAKIAGKTERTDREFKKAV